MCSTVQFSKKSILSEQTNACIPSWKCLSTFVPFGENARIPSLFLRCYRPIGYFTIFLPLCMKTPPLGLVVAVPESV